MTDVVKHSHPFFYDLLGEFWSFCTRWGAKFPNSQENRWALVDHLKSVLTERYSNVVFELLCDHRNNDNFMTATGNVILDAKVQFAESGRVYVARTMFPEKDGRIVLVVRDAETGEPTNRIDGTVPSEWQVTRRGETAQAARQIDLHVRVITDPAEMDDIFKVLHFDVERTPPKRAAHGYPLRLLRRPDPDPDLEEPEVE